MAIAKYKWQLQALLVTALDQDKLLALIANLYGALLAMLDATDSHAGYSTELT